MRMTSLNLFKTPLNNSVYFRAGALYINEIHNTVKCLILIHTELLLDVCLVHSVSRNVITYTITIKLSL